MRKALFGLVLLLASFWGKAQTFYAGGLDGLYEITITGTSCSADFIGPFIDQATGNSVFAGDIAICPDGTMYITDNTNLWEVDPNTGNATLVASSPNYLGIVGLGCAGGGILYGSAFNVNGVSGGLYLMDANTGTISLIGETGFNSSGDLANYNGTWYMTAQEGLIELDLSDPANSTVVHSGFGYSFVAMTVFPNDCNTLLGGEGSELFTIDIDDGNVNSLCSVPGLFMGGLTTISEFAPIPTVCDPTIDLDGDDSSGAPGSDYNAPNFNCSNFTGVNIADIDADIDANEDIASLTATITAGNADGPSEILELPAAANISIVGSGTNSITLNNTGSSSIADFINALTQIVYQNQTVPTTPGIREIEVSVTTVNGTQSNIAICFVTVDAFDNLEVDLGPDLSLCPGAETTLDAGNPGADYLWSNAAEDQVIAVMAPGVFSVTVSDGFNCPGMDMVVLVEDPSYPIGLSGDDLICENGTAELTFSLGSNAPMIDVTVNEAPSGQQIFLQNVVDGFSFQINPSETSTYTIAFIEDNGFCIDDFAGVSWTVSVGLNVLNQQAFQICSGDSIFFAGAWQNMPGVYTENLTTYLGCDSTVETSLSVLPASTSSFSSTTCNPSAVGVFQTTWPAANGCDSVVIETVTFVEILPTAINQTTCDPSQVGVSTQILTSYQGCDSLVITTTNLLPSDLVEISNTSCDLSEVGVFTEIFSNQNGCDSIVTTTVTFSESDTLELSDTSCDPGEVGIFTEVFSNQNGCDSTVITTVTFAQSDTTYVEMESCDPDDSGVFTQILTGANGCDSTAITTVTFTPIDDTFVFETSCDSNQTGIVVDVFSAQSGCDSVVFTQTDLLPADQTLLTFESCNPDDVGTFTETLTNQFGCDSTVITEVTLSTGSPVFISSQTCTPDDVGTFTEVFTDQFGCDSTVITSVSLSPSDTTFLSSQTCDPSAAGVFTENLSNQFGCDSLVVTSVELLISDTVFLTSQTCDPSGIGIFSEIFTNQFGCDSTIINTVELSSTDTTYLFDSSCDLSEVGVFEENWTNQAGCDSLVVTEVSLALGDTTYLSLNTCDEEAVGIFTENIAVPNGCDSVTITTVSLSPPSTTVLTESVCEIDQTGFFAVILVGENGCDSIVTTVVSLLPIEDCESARPSIYVPNAFSPNGDGINDYFLIFGNEEVRQILTIEVLSRWGERVFEAFDIPVDNLQYGWDGSFRGEPMGTGVFAFWAEVEMNDGSRQMVKGDVMLLR